MESFLDMTLDRNLYIGIPLGAFLLLPFSVVQLFPIPRVNRQSAVFGWCADFLPGLTGSVILMRLGIFPEFVSGIILHCLVFCRSRCSCMHFCFWIFGDYGHDALIYIYGVLTLALVLGNARSGTILPAPELVNRADGTYVYVYHATVGTGIPIAMEIAVMIYATYLAHCKIGGDLELRKSYSRCCWERYVFWVEICSACCPEVSFR